MKVYFKSGIVLSLVLAAIFLLSFTLKSDLQFPKHLQQTKLAKLADGDSLIYFQCYAAKAGQNPLYFSRDSVISKAERKKLITVTEKFVVSKQADVFRVRKYSSQLHDFPNKKYAYLKLVEKSYWNFLLEKEAVLSEKSVLKLAALELLLRPLTEYNFVVQHDNSPQLIINGKKVSEQRMMEGAYFIGKELEELR